MGENHFEAVPTALYGTVLLMAAVAWTILQSSIVKEEGEDSKLAKALGSGLKGYLSLACCLLAIPLAFVNEWISDAIYIAVALIWLIPDRRIEARLKE